MSLHIQLKKARKKSGLSQLEVAKRTGIKNTTLSNWEHNVSAPPYDALCALARLYCVTTDFLLLSSSDNFELPIRDTEKEQSALQKLIDTVKDDSIDEIETYIAVINALKAKNNV